MRPMYLIAIIPLSFLWQGIVVSTFWNWHIAPLVRLDINVIQAVAICSLSGFLTHSEASVNVSAIAEKLDTKDRSLEIGVSTSFSYPAALLLIGFILRVAA